MSAGSVAEYHPFTTEDNNDVLGKGRQLYRGNAVDLQRPEGLYTVLERNEGS